MTNDLGGRAAMAAHRGHSAAPDKQGETDMTEKTDNKLISTGLIGTIIAALCCFTPILAVLLGAVGLSAVLGWIDYVLLPALGFFILLTLYAVWRRQRRVRDH